MGKRDGQTDKTVNIVLRNKKILCTSITGILLILIALIAVCIDPATLITRFGFQLNSKSVLYNSLHGVKDTFDASIYLYNITNADRFISGLDAKLKLQEVGPFVYRQHRENSNMTIDDEAHVLRYTPNYNISFIRELSVGDPKTMNVTSPNIPLLALAAKLSRRTFLIKAPFNMLTKKIKSQAVVSISPHEYLWGYDDPLVKFGNTMLPGVFYFKQLGLLDRLFDPKRSLPMELDTRDDYKFQVTKLNNLGGLNYWGYLKNSTKCNTLVDTYEGYMFPFKMSPDRNLRIYHSVFCRMIDLEYVGNKMDQYDNEVRVYRFDRNAFNYSDDLGCLCPSGNCLNGTSDTSPCFYDLPLAMSKGHFLDADEKVFEKLEGLHPEKEKHGSEFQIDKDLGICYKTNFTIQLNIVMGDVRYNSIAKPFSDMLVPCSWIRITNVPLSEKKILGLKLYQVQLPYIALGIEAALLLLGVILLLYSYWQIHILRKEQNSIGHVISSSKDPKLLSIQTPLMLETKGR